MKVFAQEAQDLGRIGGEGLGPFAKTALSAEGGLAAVARTVSAVIGIMTVAAGIWFIFQLFTGGFFWITSGGDKSKLHEARERLTNAFVGLIIIVVGWSILAIVGQALGFKDILLTNPKAIIDLLFPGGK